MADACLALLEDANGQSSASDCGSVHPDRFGPQTRDDGKHQRNTDRVSDEFAPRPALLLRGASRGGFGGKGGSGFIILRL
jgi:hypothetical protein